MGLDAVTRREVAIAALTTVRAEPEARDELR
jgi:hypothetical protein